MFQKVLSVLIISFLGLNSVYGAYGFAECGVSHCSQYSVEINEACKAAGMAGKPFPVVGPNGGTCTCPCSCVIPGTLLSLENQSTIPIELARKSDFIFNPYTKKYHSQIAKKTQSSVENHQILVVKFSDGSSLSASYNHTFVRPNGTILSAEQLKSGDFVLSESGVPVSVDSKQSQAYTGDLYNLIINPLSYKVSDHIISLNGILSGDLQVQEAHDQIKNEIDLRMQVIKPLILKKGE